MERKGVAGGKTMAIISRRKALERYYANPKICLNCGKVIEVGDRKVREIRVKKFCNQYCAAVYNNTKRNVNREYKYHCIKCGTILKTKKKLCQNCKPIPNILKNSPERKPFFKTKTRLYSILKSMKERCYNRNKIAYKNYGGRGITICNEWLNDFISFYNWAMKNGYNDTLTIERIDNNGNYEPSNCKWIPKSEQSNNRRCNHRIYHNGETHTITEWANIIGVNRDTLYNRFKKIGNVERIFTNKDLRISNLQAT